MKKSFFFCPGVLGMIFRAPRLRAEPALRSSLLQYSSKGFALLPLKNGVEIAAVEGGRPVSMVTLSPRVSSGSAVILEPAGGDREASRDAGSFENQILMEITVHFGLNPRLSPTVRMTFRHTTHHKIPLCATSKKTITKKMILKMYISKNIVIFRFRKKSDFLDFNFRNIFPFS